MNILYILLNDTVIWSEKVCATRSGRGPARSIFWPKNVHGLVKNLVADQVSDKIDLMEFGH